MILPESAPMQEKDYPYLNHANAMWKRLGMIKNGAIEYCSDDYAAVAQAIKDGIKFIPVEELPENFDRRYLGWIDTPENRKHIEEYCAEMDDSRDR